MKDRQVIEWDKDDIDTLKFMKVDVLGLGMLGCMRRAFDLLSADKGLDLDLASIPAEDEATYAMIRKADTLGVFQIESRAQMAMLPRMKPRTFYDLVIEVAIVRPGPIQGDMVHPYLRRREGKDIPALDGRRRPYGTYVVRYVIMPGPWIRGGGRDHVDNWDLGGMVVRSNGRGRLTDVVGAAGYDWNISRNGPVRIFGYPGTGGQLKQCRTTTHPDRRSASYAGETAIEAQCLLAAGASGGGWFRGDFVLNGVTSFSYIDRPNFLTSAYFGGAAGRLINRLP